MAPEIQHLTGTYQKAAISLTTALDGDAKQAAIHDVTGAYAALTEHFKYTGLDKQAIGRVVSALVREIDLGIEGPGKAPQVQSR